MRCNKAHYNVNNNYDNAISICAKFTIRAIALFIETTAGIDSFTFELRLFIRRRNFCFFFLAGRTTTNEELEEMLEQGNPAVFTQGVPS